MRYGLVAFVVIVLMAPSGRSAPARAQPPHVRTATLKERFQAARRKAKAFGPSYSSDPRAVLSENPGFQEMIALGPACIPHVMEAIRGKEDDSYNLMWVAAEILKAPPPPQATGTSAAFLEWLEGKTKKGHEEAKTEFAALRKAWAETKARADTPTLWRDVTTLDPEFRVLRTKRTLTPLGEVYTKIQGLGVFVLPLLVEELRNGEYDFLPIIVHLTDGAARLHGGWPKDMAKSCLAWWAEHRSAWIVASPRPTPQRGP